MLRLLSKYILIPAFFFPLLGQAQEPSLKGKKLDVTGQGGKSVEFASNRQGTVVSAQVIDGDTVPTMTLREIRVFEGRTFANPRDAREWERLKKKVKKVYPYARLARLKMEELQREIDTLDRKKDRKQYIKDAEKELFSEFEGEIKDMTVSEGVILIKLIDRETGDSSYELVKELKGGLNAFMWQSVARIFGHNLKSEYDPAGDDKMIEEIVLLIERGDL